MTEAPSQTSLPPPIEMRGVAVAALRDQSRLVAEQIDWSVTAGQFWVIAGLHGSGKSDFLMTLGGLMPPAAGSYRLFGEEMPIFDDARLPTRLRLGLVFDGGGLFNSLTVAENVALPLRYHHDLTPSEAQAEVQRLLAAMDLVPWAEALPASLGRSWQKRLGLARALILKPELILVDDPLAGLDLRQIHWWLAFLDRLSKRGLGAQASPLTLVVTTADFRPWRSYADQFALLANKRFRALGDWPRLEAATDPHVRELLAEKPEPEQE